MEARHWLTTAGIGALIVSVAGFGLNVGMVAIIIAASLILLRTVDEQKAIKGMPWGVILMVTGVTVLIALLEETEGLALFTSGIARVSTPATIAPIVAFGTGVVSVYSSTGGVVLPAFLPMVPDLAQRMGGHRAAAHRLVDERRFEPRRSVVALDGRRAVHGRRGRRHRRAAAVQQPAGLGPVDVGRRRGCCAGFCSASGDRQGRKGQEGRERRVGLEGRNRIYRWISATPRITRPAPSTRGPLIACSGKPTRPK